MSNPIHSRRALCQFISVTLLSVSASCAGAHVDRPKVMATPPASTPSTTPAPLAESDWIGIYASPKEISGFDQSVLSLERGAIGIVYRMRARDDVAIPDDIKQDETRGFCLIDGQAVYLPVASGLMMNGKPHLTASVTRYTRYEINGRKVLMSDYALREFRDHDKLYDYGILFKVDDRSNMMRDLTEIDHPSIKLLYTDPAKEWKDPFVYGANSR